VSDCIHDLELRFMSDSPDNTPIALLAACLTCHKTWPFDASVAEYEPELLRLKDEAREARAVASEAQAQRLRKALEEAQQNNGEMEAMQLLVERLRKLEGGEQVVIQSLSESAMAEMMKRYDESTREAQRLRAALVDIQQLCHSLGGVGIHTRPCVVASHTLNASSEGGTA